MFEFSSNYAILFAVLFLIVSFLISFYFYRKTIISRWKKYVLIGLKSAATFLVLMLFLQPVFLALVNKNQNRLNIILIDDSRSLKVNGKDSAALNNLKNVLDKNNKFFSFSDKIKFINYPDSFNPDGPYTNLTSAIEQLKVIRNDNSFNSISVISDGNFNAGGNPLYSSKTLNCPVFTVPLGDTVQRKDIVISSATHNDIAYIN